MASIVAAVLKATVGLLVNKGRDLAADKLKEGDVTDEKFRNMIVRELDDIKSKLDGLARKDLLTSISFFKEGIVFLYKVLDMKSSGEERTTTEQGTVTRGAREGNSQLSLRTLNASLDKGSLLMGMETLDDSGKRALTDAKKRFDDARMKATEAFNNVALSASDRILAMQYRVMSTILEKIDNPKEAIAACRLCLEELHSMPAVQKSFQVEKTGGFWSLFNKDEREEILKSARGVNRVIFKVTEVADGVLSREFDMWPSVNIGEHEVNPLKQGSEFNSYHARVLPWSFGQEGEDEHKLTSPQSITTNTQGQFVVVDKDDVKVFDCRGNFLFSFTIRDADYELAKLQDVIRVLDVATDRDDNIYLLSNRILSSSRIYVFDKQGNMCHKFDLGGIFEWRLTVNESKRVFVLGTEGISSHGTLQVYESDGRFVNSVEYKLGLPLRTSIAIASDNQIMIFNDYKTEIRLFVFDSQGNCLRNLSIPVHGYYEVIGITYHQPTEHILIVTQEFFLGFVIYVYTKDGKHVRVIYARLTEKLRSISGITVTTDGRIAALCAKKGNESESKKHMVVVV